VNSINFFIAHNPHASIARYTIDPDPDISGSSDLELLGSEAKVLCRRRHAQASP
jgi:hypothetical protein